MNRNVLESQWAQVRDILRDKFSNLTEEDIRQINGRYDQLVAKLQQKYGYSREEAEERIRNWNFERLPGSTTTPSYTNERARREENDSSAFKWILGLGIPLLLLGAYFLSTRPETTRAPSSPIIQEQTATETPADRSITDGLRSALLSQQNLLTEVQNIQITTRNGVVTLSGYVSNNDLRSSIDNTVQRFPGVRQVVNNIEVR